jgi:hypothetical protein
MPVIVPFGRWYLKNKNKNAKILVDYIGDHYETKMSHISKEMDSIIKYSIKNLKDSQTFRKSFFRRLFLLTEKLIKESDEYEFERQ